MQSWHKFLSSALQSQGFVIISCHNSFATLSIWFSFLIYIYLLVCIYTLIHTHTYMNCTCYSMHMQVRWLLGGVIFLFPPMLVPQIGPYPLSTHTGLMHGSCPPPKVSVMLITSAFSLTGSICKGFFFHLWLLISLLFYFVAIK